MMMSNFTKCYCLVGILDCLSERLFRKYSIVCMISMNFNFKTLYPIFKRILLMLIFPLGFWLSFGSHRLIHWKFPPWIGSPKCSHLWVCLIIVVLILADMTRVGLLRLNILVYCQLPCLCTLIYSLLLSIDFSLLFQTCMMHKEAHHPSSPEILIGRLQVLLF